MNTKVKKFSDLIGDLTEMWLLWMKHNTIVRDELIPTKDRRKSSEECEKLITCEYKIIEQLDKFFSEEGRHRKTD